MPDPDGPIKIPVLALGPGLVAEWTRPSRFKVLPGTIRVQRRQFFRLKWPPIEVSVRPTGAGLPPVRPQTRNLGAGGLAISAERSDLRAGEAVELLLVLADATRIPSGGEVTRVEPLALNASLLAVRFTAIRERDRDRIVAMIFREQTRRLRAPG